MSLLSLKSRQEQIDFFQSHGLFPIFVGTDHITFAEGLNKAYGLLDRETPVIVFESPKGWTAPEFFGDTPFANTYKCHKPLLKNPATNTNQAALIEQWLRSYQPEDLFDDRGTPYESSLACLPENNFLIGNGYLWAKREKQKEFFVPTISNIDDAKISIEALEQLLFNIVKHDANFLVFSPDELISNKLGKILELSSLKFGESYERINTLSPDGQVVEILNEHLCYGWAQGYTMSGRRSVYISYEGLAPILDSITTQHLKFLTEKLGLKPPLLGGLFIV